MSFNGKTIVSTLFITAFFAGLVQAVVPTVINYQGVLTDNTGKVLTGTYSFSFSLSSGTGPTGWSETYSGSNAITVQNGLYSVQLGSLNNNPGNLNLGSLPFDTTYYLTIQVGGETLSPVQPLATSPYAFRSSYADHLSAGVGAIPPNSISAGTLPPNVIASSVAIQSVGIPQIQAAGSASASTYLAGNGTWGTPTGSGNVMNTGNNNFTGYNTFGQVQASSITITGANVVLTATAAYATNAAALDGNSSSVFILLNATQTFSGYNKFNQVQVSSITITGANVVLTATAAYASTSGSAATAASIANGVYTNANNNLSGYNTFGQVQVSSITITGANVVLTATAAYASTAGSAATASTIANGVYTNTNNTLSGYNTFGQVQASSITITGANVVLSATAAYSQNAANSSELNNQSASYYAAATAVYYPISIKIDSDSTVLVTGSPRFIFVVPDSLSGKVLTTCGAAVTTTSSSGAPAIMLHDQTQNRDMLSTAITIDSGKYSSDLSTTPPVISNGVVAVGDLIYINCTNAGTGAQGLQVNMKFQ